MTAERKVIRAKVGLLDLAKQLGNVSQACKILGYGRDSWAAAGLVDGEFSLFGPCARSPWG